MLHLVFRKPRLFLTAVLFCLGLSSISHAQDGADTVSILPSDAPTDTDYVKLFPHTFTTRIYLGEKVSVFSLHDGVTDKDIHYRPNAVLSLGLGVTVRGIGLNFSTKLPFHDKKEDQYGATKRLDVQAHRYRRKLGIDLYLQRYQGFHLNETENVTQIDGPTTYPYMPNLHQLRFGATVLHIFNGNHYSMRAAVNQQEWQVRSAGSFLLGGSLYTQFIHNEGAEILPPYYRYPEVLGGGGLHEIQNYSLCANAGYGYNFVFPDTHWFLGAAADIGAGPAYSRIKDAADLWEGNFGLNLTSNVRLQIGYNSRKWFAGLYGIAHGDRYGLQGPQRNVSTVQAIIRAVVARRFESFKLGRKQPKPVE